jgi:PAS domain S-box-containing protein
MCGVTSQVAAEAELPAEATSAGRARRLVRAVALDHGQAESLEAAELAISEIVTNALVHAGTVMRLRILVADSGLRVELADGNPRLPHTRDFDPAAVTGRGLRLVGELVSRWGAFPAGDGKVVWFEIRDDVSLDHMLPEAEDYPTADDRVVVELHRMPLLMHQAWQEHAAALLRELMLVRLDAELSALAEHAVASDALSVLLDQVPAPDVGSDPQALMANATEPAVSVQRLVVEVPRASVPGFEALDVLLDEALHLAGEGELLVPPTQPEIEAMRRWICEQVATQAAGGRSTAWETMAAARPPRPRLPDAHWHPGEVTESPRAELAADDANRIVAISGPALELLGYDDAEELVDRRLIAIIPERFHQAHVAGFTMFLVNGRGPLLDTEVTVPVRRRDGSEVEHGLVITARSLPEGRYVFHARFLD